MTDYVLDNPLQSGNYVLDDPTLDASAGLQPAGPADVQAVGETPTSALRFIGQSQVAIVSSVAGFPGFAADPTGLLAQSSDPDGDPLSWEIVSLPNRGTLSMNVGGSWSYTPDPGKFGMDTFDWRVWGGGEPSSVQTESILIEGNLVASVGDSETAADAATAVRGFRQTAVVASVQADSAPRPSVRRGFKDAAGISDSQVDAGLAPTFIGGSSPFTGRAAVADAQSDGAAPSLVANFVGQALVADSQAEAFIPTVRIGFPGRAVVADVQAATSQAGLQVGLTKLVIRKRLLLRDRSLSYIGKDLGLNYIAKVID